MSRWYYDFHLHSCLSPCADDDMTPNNIAGMAKLAGLQLAALTDHNSCRNCPAFFEAAARQGIVPVAGMELTTAEDIHGVCLFEFLADAMRFCDEVDRQRVRIPNRADIFGNQLLLDGNDEPLGTEPDLLSNATAIPLPELPPLVAAHGGVCYPAHIDRESNGMVSVLGDFPADSGFACAELHEMERAEEYLARCPALREVLLLSGSDAHYLWDIREKRHWLELGPGPDAPPEAVRRALFRLLRREEENRRREPD